MAATALRDPTKAAQILGEPGCATHTYLMRAIKPFVRDPFAQFAEARGSKPGAQDPLAGAPAFDFLTGEGGFTQVFTNGLTGLRWRADRVHLDPMLPPQLERGVTLKGLHRQGRTFDISVGPDNTRVSVTAGQPLPVESPQGTQLVSSGNSLTLKTRRPDLAPTDNAARCQPTQASSEEAGMYSEAAVDGSAAEHLPDPRLCRRHPLDAGAACRSRRQPPAPGQPPICPRRPHSGDQRRTDRPARAGSDPEVS